VSPCQKKTDVEVDSGAKTRRKSRKDRRSTAEQIKKEKHRQEGNEGESGNVRGTKNRETQKQKRYKGGWKTARGKKEKKRYWNYRWGGRSDQRGQRKIDPRDGGEKGMFKRSDHDCDSTQEERLVVRGRKETTDDDAGTDGYV